MTQTDRILSNIGAIRTLLENFPMGLFDKDGKTYTSAFEFIMDVLRCCGINDQELISYIIGKIYGFEGKPGYTINGLYEKIKRGDINVDMQNQFISGLETSIKAILMALFTSIYTCSALPILPNKVFDYDDLGYFMTNNVSIITRRNQNNDRNYKLKIPVSTIDIMGMLSISPTTSDGSLYYLTDGHDVYYHKEYIDSSWTITQSRLVNAGELYSGHANTYDSEYLIYFGYEFPNGFFTVKKYDIAHGTTDIAPAPTDLLVNIDYLEANTDAAKTKSVLIPRGESSVDLFALQNCVRVGDDFYPTKILGMTINGNAQGCEVGNSDDGLSWAYLTTTNGDVGRWETNGAPIDIDMFGHSKSGETSVKVLVADVTDNYMCEVEQSATIITYKSVESGVNKDVAIRYAYVPEYVYEEDPDDIVCYEGMNPNLVYRAYDMNAFIWYCYNRFNIANQEEENHLMWDSRISASKNGIIRSNGTEWNRWYSSKSAEGKEFEYISNPESEVLYPIIQVERYNDSELLVRIPAQRYYAPRKREEIYNGTYDGTGHYFNASVYRFDWEYLKNIQILNPKLLLVRLIEHLIGLSLDAASNLKFNVTQKRIEAVLSKAVKSIITANDMEVEDCWKSFSNEDYNDLLEEILLSRYTASKTNGESSRIRTYDINDYVNQLDQISQNVTSQGTTTMITKTVTNVMMTDGSEESTEYGFEYGFDSNMLSKLIWAVVMPIVESLFTPQVMLLMMINFQLLGVVNIDNAFGNDFTKILNLLINKLLGLVKSIVLYIKDKIIALLLELFNKIITPILTNMALMLYLEMITDWLVILLNAVKCIPMLFGGLNKPIGYIEDVDYADIVNEQNVPESTSEC